MLLYSSPRWFVPDLLLVPHSERPCGAGARRREGSERCGKTSGSRLSAHSTDELPGLSGYWWIHKGCGMHLSAISKCTPTSTWETRRFRSVCLCFFFFTFLQLQMAEEQSDFVFGFICGSKISKKPEFIHMSPGVQMQAGGKVDPRMTFIYIWLVRFPRNTCQYKHFTHSIL